MPSTLLAIGPRTRLELLSDDGGAFLGIGAVSVGEVALRSTRRPIVLRLDTPDGILYPRLELAGVARDGDGARVTLRAIPLGWGRGEYADDYDQTFFWPQDELPADADTVELLLAPAGQRLGERDWEGFSLAVRFASASRQIHRIVVHATWEIGGSVDGNTLLSQGQCNMPVYRGAKETLFTTACLRTLDLYGQPQGNSFQMAPRGGLIQAFDFQVADAGALLQYWPAMDSISSLIESPPGSELVHVIDEYHFPLTNEVTTTAKVLLFTPGQFAEHEARDLWYEAREHIHGGIRQASGVAMTVPLPEIPMNYRTRVAEGRLRMSVGGEEVDSTELPYAIAQDVLPKLAAQGIRRFFPQVMSESDVTQLGMRRKLDNGIHGDLHCASVCATHRFFPSDFWGGIEAWRHMYDAAHALGIELGAWFAPHFSPRAPIYEQHPDWRMVSVTGLPAGGGYGFQTLCVADWNTPIREWVLDDLRRWKEEGGLDFLFVDSLSNLGYLQVNYAAQMRTNYHALARLFRDIQALGIRDFTCECISPMMVGRFGVADLRGDLLEQNRAVAGQNDFGWWTGEEDMAIDLCLMAGPRKRTPKELERFLFRTMASRGYLGYEHQYGLDHQLADWWVRLNRIYLQAVPSMTGRRRLLPGRQGVRWEDAQGRSQLIWTFAETTVELPAGAKVERLTGGDPEFLGHGPDLTLPAWSACRLG